MEFVRRAYVPEALRGDAHLWPYTVLAVAALVRQGLTFTRPVTFLVGDNGSGKSTIVEALAEGFGLDARGGRAARKTGNPNPDKTALGQAMRLELTAKGARMLGGPRLGKNGFFLRAETAFSMTENLGGVAGYWDDDTGTLSHGEGSFTASLNLVALFAELSTTGAQVVCATH